MNLGQLSVNLGNFVTFFRQLLGNVSASKGGIDKTFKLRGCCFVLSSNHAALCRSRAGPLGCPLLLRHWHACATVARDKRDVEDWKVALAGGDCVAQREAAMDSNMTVLLLLLLSNTTAVTAGYRPSMTTN